MSRELSGLWEAEHFSNPLEKQWNYTACLWIIDVIIYWKVSIRSQVTAQMQGHVCTQGSVSEEKSNLEPGAQEHLLCAWPPGPLNLTSSESELPTHSSDCLISSSHRQGRCSLLHCLDVRRKAGKFKWLCHCLTASLLKDWDKDPIFELWVDSLFHYIMRFPIPYTYMYRHARIEQWTKHEFPTTLVELTFWQGERNYRHVSKYVKGQ